MSGHLGDAGLAVAARTGRVALEPAALAACQARLDRPMPRVALGLALRGVATAMLDVSDGLTGDLGHILERSNVGASVALAAVPRSALMARLLAGSDRAAALACLLAGGDDYELCFTAAPESAPRVAAIAVEAGLPLTRIGTITAGGGLVVRDEYGAVVPAPRAFDHFAAGS